MSELPGQVTIDEALSRSVWRHAACGGAVEFNLAGGRCLRCLAAPLQCGEYLREGAAQL